MVYTLSAIDYFSNTKQTKRRPTPMATFVLQTGSIARMQQHTHTAAGGRLQSQAE